MKSKKEKWEDIIAEFRGKDKIIAERVERLPDGRYRLLYREGKGKQQEIVWIEGDSI